MKRLRIVGIGPGGPDQLTLEAVAALREVDVFLVADKGEGVADLVAVREQLLAAHAPNARLVAVPDPERDRSPSDYGQAVDAWHEARAAAYEQVIAGIPDDQVGGFLVWGDPSLYDSTIRVVERVRERGILDFEYDVVAGVSSVQLLAARYRIVLHRVGEPVVITTGRRLADHVRNGDDNLVVMLDGHLQCAELCADQGDHWDIWWGANLGTSAEVLVSGRLADVLPEIRKSRDEAKAARGWVMDVYLLRRNR
ncbi:MAG TPA: precorrin-6A synthase (deacetylating) [Nocardioidaceae bacterium]|nr:precorrin-6A synthase (deacetylating) [Nocardioidaceae bacterium]